MTKHEGLAIDPSPDGSQPTLTRTLITFLTKGDQWHLFALAVTSIVAALAETVGVASIAPFMAVLLDPAELERQATLRSILRAFGAHTHREHVVLLGIGVSALVVINNLIGAASIAYQASFTNGLRSRISVDLFRRILSQPYPYHLKNDSAALTKYLVSNVDAFTRVLASILTIVSRALVIVALVALLLSKAALAAFLAVTAFGGTYLLFFALLRRWQVAVGEASAQAQGVRSRTALEALGGIKELTVLGRATLPIDTFEKSSRVIARTQAQSTLAGTLPRSIIEPIGMMAVVFIALTLTRTPNASSAGAISVLALFAFVAFRLIPAFQQLYAAFMEIKYLDYMVIELRDAWVAAGGHQAEASSAERPVAEAPTPDAPLIALRNVSFVYPGATSAVLRQVSLEIRKGEAVGFVGRSGSGKTTLIDLLLGLYAPSQGELRVSGLPLTGQYLPAWRKRIGYVPQHVFLVNATVAENVALGVPVESIDQAAVRRALEKAQCLAFVEQLEDGVNSVVGERGVRLSGGQRQRLGIARALYHDPDTLILDEATSALDGATEDAVMDAVNSLRGERTIILIAHRLRTVELCDRIIVMNGGQIVGDARYRHLAEHNPYFKELLGSVA